MRFRFFDRLLPGADTLDETLTGGSADDLILGLGGDDHLVAHHGSDTADGGAGHDRLAGRNGDDLLLGGHGNDHLDGGADDDRLEGGTGADTLIGGVGDDALFGGADDDLLEGGRNHDTLAGNSGADTLRGGSGNDTLWGGAGNDLLEGGDGHDILAAGFGADRLNGGQGNDRVLSRSDAGEPPIAADPAAPRVTTDTLAANDTLAGGMGADLFRWELVVNAPEEIAEAHADARGWINWGAVTGENDGLHDHWVDGIGIDVVTDFSLAQGDRIEVAGHTVRAAVTIADLDGDGAADDTRIRLYSDQGPNGGAHHLDELGEIWLLGAQLTAAQVSVDPHKTYGAYDRIGEGPHRLEDAGRMADGGFDWDILAEVPGEFRQGGAAADNFGGSVDDDSLFGSGGSDTLRGSDGDDILDGGAEHDRLLGGNDDDLLLGGDGNDTADGGADKDKLSGGAGNDSLLGGVGDDHLFGGGENDTLDGGRNDDSVVGGRGDDVLRGDSGDDDLWGGAGNDTQQGGDGNDFLVAGFGADLLDGGRGNDTILARSDDGEPTVAADPSMPRVFADSFASADMLTGGLGADLFRWELQVNAPHEIAEAHADARGSINWGAVTGENDGLHDHWVDGIGTDVITDFSLEQGDRIEIAGHTVHVTVALRDLDGDGAVDDTRIRLYSDQGPNGGAHHMDELGRIHVLNATLTTAQVSVDHHETYGAYGLLGEGPWRFEDAGIWLDGGSDWGLWLPTS